MTEFGPYATGNGKIEFSISSPNTRKVLAQGRNQG